MKKLLFLITFIFSLKSLACTSVTTPFQLNMAISPLENKSFFYNDTRLINDRPDISLENCISTAQRDKYLMFAVALENFILSDDFLTYSINDAITGSGDQCTIENNQYQRVQDSSERRKRLIQKREFINKCLTFSITDFSQAGLNISEEQVGCQVTRISKYAASFKGPFCFVKPNIDSSLSLTIDVDKACHSLETFKENKILLQDALGVLSIYTAGDETGYSPDLTAVKQTNLRVSVNAPEKLLATNAYRGEQIPVWPTSWNMPDIYLAKPKAYLAASSYDELYFPFLVDNRCERKCLDGLCSSPCDFTQPVVGDFALFEKGRGSKKELVTSWFDGGVAPAQWQGILNGTGVKLPKNLLEIGRDYILEVDLSDQELNYLSFKGRLKKLVTMHNVIGEINREGTAIREIPLINTIDDIEKLPSIRTIHGISFTGNGFLGVKEALRSVQLTFKNSFWPPYFEQTCFNGKCVKQGSMKNKISLSFKLGGTKEKPVFENVVFQRKSNVVASKNISNYNFPVVNCGIDTDEDDDLDLGDFDF